MLNLVNLYKQLKAPLVKTLETKSQFSACPIPGYSNHRLARDYNNYPCLLIAAQNIRTNIPGPIKLEHLQVLYDLQCRISRDDSFEENRFTVIRCTEQDLLLQEYFLRICGTIITAIGNAPTHAQVSVAVGNFVELFRSIRESPRKSVQGLWAELLFISLSKDPSALVKAWHTSPDDKYDFSSDNQRIEIKSCSSAIRKHHFSLEQLNPPLGVKVIICSVFVERVGAGMSLSELADKVRHQIENDSNLLLYLDHIIGVTLGTDWRLATKDRFDYQLAKKSVAFYSTENVPSIKPDFPKSISDVHFKVELTDVNMIDKKIFKSDGIFNFALSKR